ncbi:MAG: hypothetical protein ACJA1E_001032, partial [Paracoccaceae bacterium]
MESEKRAYPHHAIERYQSPKPQSTRQALQDKPYKTSPTRQALQDKPYKISDFEGLFILIKTSGSKSWRFKYRVDGKEKLLVIGD